MNFSVYGILTDMRKLLFLVAAVALAQRPWPPPGMRCPERTLVITDLVQANASKINEFYDEHIAFLVPLLKSGKIISAGPTDDGRGVLLFGTKDWTEVEAILKKEPFTREGVMKIVSHSVWKACEAAK
jgi:uncharacterized protein YciI